MPTGLCLIITDLTCTIEKKLVLVAITEHGMSIEDQTNELRNDDLEVILAAVSQNVLAIRHVVNYRKEPTDNTFIPSRFRSNKEVALQAVKQDGSAFCHLMKIFKTIQK